MKVSKNFDIKIFEMKIVEMRRLKMSETKKFQGTLTCNCKFFKEKLGKMNQTQKYNHENGEIS